MTKSITPQKYTIDLTYEFIDHIIKTELADQYKSLCESINKLQKKEHLLLEDYEQQDLLDNIKFRKSILTVLEYYTTPDELKELIDQE